MEVARPRCTNCGVQFPDDGKVRKRSRPRKCEKCARDARSEARQHDPVRVLCHRWSKACYRLGVKDPQMWSPTVVRTVMERWENKCAVTGETRPELLCIAPYWDPKKVPVKSEHLVLVTSHVAQDMARVNDRHSLFPQRVKDAFEQVE